MAAIDLESLGMVIVTIYRSPSGIVNNFFDLLDNCLTYLTGSTRKIVLGSDLKTHLEKSTEVKHHVVDLLRSHRLFHQPNLQEEAPAWTWPHPTWTFGTIKLESSTLW